MSSSHAVDITIISQYSDYTLTFSADIIGRLPYEIAAETRCAISQLDSTLQLADKGVESTEVNLLIGTEFNNRILKGEKKLINGVRVLNHLS